MITLLVYICYKSNLKPKNVSLIILLLNLNSFLASNLDYDIRYLHLFENEAPGIRTHDTRHSSRAHYQLSYVN